jgi:hypothetical protein
MVEPAWVKTCPTPCATGAQSTVCASLAPSIGAASSEGVIQLIGLEIRYVRKGIGSSNLPRSANENSVFLG